MYEDEHLEMEYENRFLSDIDLYGDPNEDYDDYDVEDVDEELDD